MFPPRLSWIVSGRPTFTELVYELDAEQKRAVEEGLKEDELALFDLLWKETLGKAERERVKQASRDLLAAIKGRLAELDRFWEKEQRTSKSSSLIRSTPASRSRPSPPKKRRRLPPKSMTMSGSRRSAAGLRRRRDTSVLIPEYTRVPLVL